MTIQTMLAGLNEQQAYSAQFDQGSLIVFAGPGAGKTKTLVTRIANILNKYPKQKFKILALTFSRNAAKEMKERVDEIVGYNSENRLFVGTYHSFCLNVLKNYGHYIELKNDFTIYQNDEELIGLTIFAVNERINREIENSNDYPPILSKKFFNHSTLEATIRGYYYAFSRHKKAFLYPEDLENSERLSPEYKLTYKLYVASLHNNNALDYNDLIYYTHKLFRAHPYLLKRYQSIYKYIMIDEGQDCMKNQIELVKLLSSNNYNNLFLVADEDQLIYEWNDAKFEYLKELQELHSAKIIQLFINYRSPQPILNLANRLIRHNEKRMESKIDLKASEHNESRGEITLESFSTPEDERDYIIESLKSVELNETCIIARNRYILDDLAEVFERNHTPYNKGYGLERFGTVEYQLVIYFFYLLANEDDQIHLNYIVNHLKLDNEEIELTALENKTTKLNAFLNIIEKSHNNLYQLIRKSQNNKENLFKSDFLEQLINELPHTVDLDDELLVDDKKHLAQLIRDCKHDKGNELTINDFLTHLAISPKPTKKEGVSLLTGHGAKGLEFSNVFIISLNQGIWPDYRSINEQSKLEEERRNLFVSLTRSRKKLTITYTDKKRTRFGIREHEPSSFLYEMGLLERL